MATDCGAYPRPLLRSLAGVLPALWLLAACVASVPQPSRFESPYAAVRSAIAGELGMPVSLRVEQERRYGAWAYLSGRPLTADGAPIDYSATPFAEDMAEGFLDDNFVALLHFDAIRGWSITELALGATDAPFVDWPARHGVPRQLILPEKQ
ncbi:MAG: hypothetical protein H6945_20920 [Zoogloeaceae bacterium]|nr:hypothetical protein [Zoogloeaceae bacterium]